ncbi:MAG: sigma factor, partial [Phycisphaerales bacterium]|nr:sigma factor [Phycisphaerales bacterium]
MPDDAAVRPAGHAPTSPAAAGPAQPVPPAAECPGPAPDPDAAYAEALLPLVYDELRALAGSRLRREARGGAGLTLQPTALVHEAFL